ncbi:MAG: hypothetical protein HXY45_06370 [Syntrophaceae bacterium]|jgi:hypothetical protein|nr:hypothetical protein [Syntrophaceae bacterium]
MEETSTTTQETAVPKKEKLSFGKKFLNFLMYGGFIVILIAAVAIVILVEKLMK